MGRHAAWPWSGKPVVYGLVDPRDDEIRYVGATTMHPANRLNQHVQAARHSHIRGHSALRSIWIREVLAAGLRPKIIPLQVCFDADEAAEVETAWIRRLKAQLVNQAEGGSGLPNPDPEVRAKLSASLKRRWAEDDGTLRDMVAERGRRTSAIARLTSHTPEADAKRSRTMRERGYRPPPMSDEQRAALAERRRGTKASPETRAKLRAAQQLRRQREREKREGRA